MNDACLTESRREERVLQLLRLLNPCLEKRKETTKRHLFFTGTRSCPPYASAGAQPLQSTRLTSACLEKQAPTGRTAISTRPGACPGSGDAG